MKLIPGNAASSAVILTAGMAAETLLQLVFVLVVSRGLGPEAFGYLGYLIAFMMIASTIVHFGLPVVAVREIAQRPREQTEIFAAAYRIRQTLGLSFFVAAVTISIVDGESLQRTVSLWLVFFYLLILPFELTPIFDARKLWRWDVPGKLAGRLSSLVLLFILWGNNGKITLLDAALCTAIVNVVNIAVSWRIAIGGGMRIRLFSATNEVKSLFIKSAPVTWSNLMEVLYSQTQILYVQWLSTALQTGYFALVARLIMPLLLFKGVLYRILLPLISSVATDPAALRSRLEQVFPIVALLCIPLTVLAILLANSVLVPLFGEEYAGAVLPFQIAVSQIIFTGFGSLFGTSLLAAGDARPSTIALTIGTAIGLLAGFLLVPKFGAVGAAWAFWIGSVISTLYPIPAFFRYCQPKVAFRIVCIAAPCILAVAINFSVIYIWHVSAIAAATIACVSMIMGLVMSGELSRARMQKILELIRWQKQEGNSGY